MLLGMGLQVSKDVVTLAQRLRSIFASGTVNGAIYDPSIQASLNQLSTGTTPVTAVTQPVGLMLDTRLGMALGPELVTNGGPSFTATTDWVARAGCTIAATGGNLVGTSTGAGPMRYYFPTTTVVGKSYQLTCVIAAVTGTSPSIYVYSAVGDAQIAVVATPTAGTYTLIFIATTTTSNIEFGNVANTGAGQTYSVASITEKLLEGNHALQATAGARPTWQVDAQGFKYLSFLGTDDSLTSATGGGGSAGFFWCGVVQPTGGAGTRVLWDDSGLNIGYIVFIMAQSYFALTVGNGSTATTLWTAATVDIGTKYLLTAWDDGINLNVQVNSAAPQTTARPVVVAGTTGYTLCKDNGAASAFFIGNLYASVYFRDTAGTAAERAAAQAYCRSMAGM